MARWATTCEIAGIVFTGCRAEIRGAGDSLLPRGGSVDWANDHTPHIHTFNRGIVGNQFGIEFVSMDITGKLTPLLAALTNAEDANQTFVVKIADGIYNINANCMRDVSKEWLTHGKHSEGWYETVTSWFIIKSAV